jgi:hypothetical protein
MNAPAVGDDLGERWVVIDDEPRRELGGWMGRPYLSYASVLTIGVALAS